MKFLGIDLGWVSGATGLCCLEWRQGWLHLRDLDRRLAIHDILAWVDAWAPTRTPAMVAVDAPTQITNPTGMRECDRLAHIHFGRYHAGCYPANLQSPFASRTLGFGCSLEARGYTHAPYITPQPPGRHQIEVFPHTAMIRLFQLPRILKYKKGKLADRRRELHQLRDLILTRLPNLDPPLAPIDLPEIPTTGAALKDLEDRLDSLICAYVAAHWWHWGLERNQVLGEQILDGNLFPANTPGSKHQLSNSGYIIVPQLPS